MEWLFTANLLEVFEKFRLEILTSPIFRTNCHPITRMGYDPAICERVTVTFARATELIALVPLSVDGWDYK